MLGHRVSVLLSIIRDRVPCMGVSLGNFSSCDITTIRPKRMTELIGGRVQKR